MTWALLAHRPVAGPCWLDEDTGFTPGALNESGAASADGVVFADGGEFAGADSLAHATSPFGPLCFCGATRASLYSYAAMIFSRFTADGIVRPRSYSPSC